MRSKVTTAVTVTLACLLLSVATADAAFPGRNGKIAVVRTVPSLNTEIYVMNPDGTGQTDLSNDPTYDREPTWSPDGRKIAFVRYHDDGGEIYVMNADGSGQTRISDDPARDRDPSWAPEGTRIAFASDRGDPNRTTCGTYPNVCHFAIYAMNADGTDVTRLTDPGAGADFDPKWSPAGTKIAFDRYTNLQRPDGTSALQREIRATNLDSGGESIILSRTSDDIGPGDWSPDGSAIVFAHGEAIDVIGADGSNLRNVASCSSNVQCPADTAVLYKPVFSPDGTKIVYSHTDCYFLRGFPCSDPYLQTVNPDGTDVSGIPSGPAEEPSWQPLVGPQRADYRNAPQFCKAERDFLGERGFSSNYGTNGNGANAYGKCVSAG